MVQSTPNEDPGLRIESFAIIKLRGVTTKLNIILRKFSLRIEPAASEVKGERSDH